LANREQEEYFKEGGKLETVRVLRGEGRRNLSHTLEVTSCVRDTEVSGEYNSQSRTHTFNNM
jgi:hypothetical protein